MSIDNEPTVQMLEKPDEGNGITAVNSVVLAGTISVPGETRQIAGGVEVVRWTLRVSRGPERNGSDLIDCIAVEPVLQQRALAWALGTPLTASGAIRRRFFRASGRTTTRVEVEVDEVTLLAAA
jgi:hypothetical protein